MLEYKDRSPTSFAALTSYTPLDTLVFRERYTWNQKEYFPDSVKPYIVGEDIPIPLARDLIRSSVAKVGPTLWRNEEEFNFFVESVDAKVRKIFVPKYSKTNFYSVPRFAWSIYPQTGVGRKAAHIHDLLCDDSEVLFSSGDGRTESKVHPVNSKDAAIIFREAMVAALVPKREVYVKYWAVRLFGPRFKATL